MNLRVASLGFAEALGVRARPRVAFGSRSAVPPDYATGKAMRGRIALPKHCVQNNATQREAPV
jgi:hypothetical protein